MRGSRLAPGRERWKSATGEQVAARRKGTQTEREREKEKRGREREREVTKGESGREARVSTVGCPKEKERDVFN